jgi:hypothetical protein
MGQTGMAGASMEHLRISDHPSVSSGGCMEMEAAVTGCGLVDSGGSAGNSLFYSIHDPALGSEAGAGSVFEPFGIRPQFDWNSVRRDGPSFGSKKEQTMTERRSATTIEQLDVHFGYMMEELQNMRRELVEMKNVLATKEELNREVAALRVEMQSQAPKTIWKKWTEIALGISAIAAAFWVVVSVLRALHIQ